MSLGMKQGVGLFIDLITSDEFILLDEPTNGLDPNGINNLLTFIISSHILSNLKQVCTKNYLLKNHKLICLNDDVNAKYKFYTEDLSMKSLMTLLKLNDLAFERQKHDILVKGIEKITQVLRQEGIPFTYEKAGLSEVLFNGN